MRRFRRKSVVRKSSVRNSKRPEWKIFTANFPSTEITATAVSAATSSCPATTFLKADILNNIVQGTAENQRIGNRIFVKKIQWRFTVYLCPQGNSVSLNSAAIRFIIGSAGWNLTAGTSLSGFFDTATNTIFDGALNRRKFSFFKDKTVHLNSGYPAITTAGGVNVAGTGMVKRVNLTCNVNKQVKYYPGGANVSDESNSYNLFALGTTPNLGSNVEVRVACMTYRVRIWYTDD